MVHCFQNPEAKQSTLHVGLKASVTAEHRQSVLFHGALPALDYSCVIWDQFQTLHPSPKWLRLSFKMALFHIIYLLIQFHIWNTKKINSHCHTYLFGKQAKLYRFESYLYMFHSFIYSTNLCRMPNIQEPWAMYWRLTGQEAEENTKLWWGSVWEGRLYAQCGPSSQPYNCKIREEQAERYSQPVIARTLKGFSIFPFQNNQQERRAVKVAKQEYKGLWCAVSNSLSSGSLRWDRWELCVFQVYEVVPCHSDCSQYIWVTEPWSICKVTFVNMRDNCGEGVQTRKVR